MYLLLKANLNSTPARSKALRWPRARPAQVKVAASGAPRPLPPPRAASLHAGPLHEEDQELLGALRPLLGAVCRQMQDSMQGHQHKGAGSGKCAVSALAAAEASGDIPFLTGRQREALRGALARSAAAIQTGDEEYLAPGELSDQEDDEMMANVTTLAREAYDTMLRR